jgi:hypothetical protein
MSETDKEENTHEEQIKPLVEGHDFYLENGLMVLTSHFLLARGYCCKSGCRHCPYGFTETKLSE